ncbi:hypothetical protein JCM9279_002095 [Rhodotorula babjevae]
MSSLASTSKWTLDYALADSSRSSIRDPPGYSPQLSIKDRVKAANVVTSKRPEVDLNELRQAKAWELALAPAKAVPMQAFMMYMSGGGIQIFSIMSVWFLLKQAVSGMLGVDKAFAPYEAASKPKPGAPKSVPQSYLEQKIVYVICQFGLLAVGLWKVNSMGLLPTSAEDWAPVFGQFLGAGPLDAPAPGFMPIKVVPAPPLSSAVA